MQIIRDFLEAHVKVSNEEWELLASKIKVHHYKKGDVITYKDNIWTDFIYINRGLIRSFIINEKGKDFTRQFYFNTEESTIAHLFVVDFTSILTQAPSSREFEVLEDSEVLIFSKKTIYDLYGKSSKWEHIGRIISESSYLDMDNYYQSLLTQSTKERYVHLTKTMSKLIEKVPQYHVASYLGITPVSLSRIKKSLKP